MQKNNIGSLSGKARLGFLLKDSIVYGGVNALSKAVTLITFPLIARHFSVSDYGVLDYFLVLGNFIAVFIVFGQDSAVARYFYEYEGLNERRQLISQSLVFQFFCLIFICGLAYVILGNNFDLFHIASNQYRLLIITLAQLPFLLLMNFSQNLLKWTFRRAQFLIISLGFTTMQAVFTVAAVVIFGAAIEFLLIVNLLTSVIFGALGLNFIRSWLLWPKNFLLLKEMLPYAIPIGLVCILTAVSPIIERSLAGALLGAEKLGLYAVSAKIAMLMGLLIRSFQTAWGPFSLSLYKEDNAFHTYNWVFKLFVIGACIASLFLSLAAPQLIRTLASDRYAGAAIVVFPLSIAFAIQAGGWITEIGISISKRSYLSLYSSMLSVSITLLGIWLFVGEIGLLGIGFGVLFGQIVKAIFSSWLAQRACPMPWQYGPAIVLYTITILLGSVSIWVAQSYGERASTFTACVAILIVSYLGWRLVLNCVERQRLIFLIKELLFRDAIMSKKQD